MKKLVIYYSLDGNTRFIAENIARSSQADILELKTEIKLPTNSFGKHFVGGGMVFKRETPALLPFDKNPTDYDMIIIGTPVWAFNFSPPIRSLLTKCKITGKKIAFFCSCGGMPGKTIPNMKELLTGNEFVGEKIFINALKNKEKTEKDAIEFVKTLSVAS